jgi:hypothetical protein
MKKLGLIILVAVMALGALGAAYAAWTQNLYANATVNTGSVAAEISSSAANAGPIGVGSPLNPLTTATLTLGSQVYTNDTLIVTIANAYPGLTVFIPFTVYNTGTVGLVATFGTATGGADLSVGSGILPGPIAANGNGTGSYIITVGPGAPSGASESISLPIICNQAS